MVESVKLPEKPKDPYEDYEVITGCSLEYDDNQVRVISNTEKKIYCFSKDEFKRNIQEIAFL